MDKLCKYVDKELEELENKAGMSGKLSGAELEYADKLAHLKKSLLTNEAMESSGYSGNRSYNDRSYRSYENGMSRDSYARGRNARRDSRGRYSSEYSQAKEEMTDQLYELMEKAPDDQMRREIERVIHKMEQ